MASLHASYEWSHVSPSLAVQAWEVATVPIQSIGMNLFMLWMSGSSPGEIDRIINSACDADLDMCLHRHLQCHDLRILLDVNHIALLQESPRAKSVASSSENLG
eukprot:2907643-Amphidinium_carterae.1